MARTNPRKKKQPDFFFFVRLNKNQNKELDKALENGATSKKEIESTANDRLSDFIAIYIKKKHNLDVHLKQISSFPDEDSRCSLELQRSGSILVNFHLSNIFLKSSSTDSKAMESDLTRIMRGCIKAKINNAINTPHHYN